MKRPSSLVDSEGVEGSMIDTGRINSQHSHGKFKRFNLLLLHVGIKTVYITVYNRHREDQQSLHEKVIASACAKVITSACEKVITSAHEKAIASTHEKAIASVCEKVITFVDPGALMINVERINSQLSNGKFQNI